VGEKKCCSAAGKGGELEKRLGAHRIFLGVVVHSPVILAGTGGNNWGGGNGLKGRIGGEGWSGGSLGLKKEHWERRCFLGGGLVVAFLGLKTVIS